MTGVTSHSVRVLGPSERHCGSWGRENLPLWRTLGTVSNSRRGQRGPEVSSLHQAHRSTSHGSPSLALDSQSNSRSGQQLLDPARARSSNPLGPGWAWWAGWPWPPLTRPHVLQDDGPLEAFCSTRLSPARPHSALLTDTPSAAPTRPLSTHRPGPSLPSPPLPAVHPEPDTHTQPEAQRPPNVPMLAPHSILPSVPESCRRGKESDQSQHSWVPAPCPVDTCTHTHIHESHALLGLCHQQLLPQPEMASSPSVCLPPLSVPWRRHRVISMLSVARCLHPLELTDWVFFLSLHLGKEPSGLLPWPTSHGPQSRVSHSPPGPGQAQTQL